MNNYYKNQLKDIFVLNGYGFKTKIKFTSPNNNTNWIDLNNESLPIIIKELQKSLVLSNALFNKKEIKNEK